MTVRIGATGGGRRGRQATIDNGLSFDRRASIAPDKFNRALQRHVRRANRNRVLGAVRNALRTYVSPRYKLTG